MEANEAHQMLFLCGMFQVSTEGESLINSEDDAVDIFSVASTFMRWNLQQTEGYFEQALPGYSLDEFKSHFQMTRGNVHLQKKLRTSKNFYLPLLYAAHLCCNKFSRSGTRTWQAEHS